MTEEEKRWRSKFCWDDDYEPRFVPTEDIENNESYKKTMAIWNKVLNGTYKPEES